VAETGSGGVLIVGEVAAAPVGGELRPVAWEMVTAGRAVADALGGPLVGLLFGKGVEAAARAFGAAGLDRLLVVDDERLDGAPAQAATVAVARAVALAQPRVVLIPGTTAGRDYAPRLAARLDVGLAADCVALALDASGLVATRPVLGGRLQTDVRFPESRPQVATVRPGSFDKAETAGGAAPDPEPLDVELGPDDLRVAVQGLRAGDGAAAGLADARTIVAGGRGLKEPENFALVEELAGALGAAVGASRAVVDAGWRPHGEQVGQTGQTVAPRLYVAVGISGAVQHLVGMQGSDYVVAINRDPDAPIFKTASFGIVGDLFEVVPAITQALKG